VLDSDISLGELSRITTSDATLCLCCEVPVDGRGGVEAFIDEVEYHGWKMAAHRQMSIEATNTWRAAEADLVRRRPYFEARYGTRPTLPSSTCLATSSRLRASRTGHGLFVFERR